MDKLKRPIKKQYHDDNEFFNAESVVSATECTGLIQTPPISVDEAESYSEIYDVPHTDVEVNNGLQHE